MISCKQKPLSEQYVLGTRVNISTYYNMLPLMSVAGYENVSTFVRDALITKCQDIAEGLTDELESTIKKRKR